MATTDCGPLAARTAVNAPYLDGLAAGVLRLQFCAACAAYQFYPRPLCMACGAPAPDWADASGRGRLYAVSWLAMAPSAPFKPLVPYGIGLVDLEEGPRMMAHIRPDDSPAMGDPVIFESAVLIDGAAPVPVFGACSSARRPAAAGGVDHA